MLYLTPAFTVYCCFVAALLGACMGSFLNCMAWRVVHGESVLRGRSHCDVCGHVLTVGDLVPVVSYLVHRGRCRWCGAKLSARHMWGEAAAAVTFTALLLRYDISLQMLEALLLACVLGIVFALVTLKRRGTEGDARLIPWGPSISAAAILTLLWGDAITAAYLSLF